MIHARVDSRWTAKLGWGLKMGKGAATVKLTKRLVDSADLTRGRHYIWDSDVRGFGLQVEASGTKTYFVRYRIKGHGRDGARKFLKIGRHGELTPDQARERAKELLGRVAAGNDPAAEIVVERQTAQAAARPILFQDVSDIFIREHVQAKRKANTSISYEGFLRKHAQPVLGQRPIADISRPELIKLHLAMRDSPHAANRLIAIISSLFTFAAKRGIVAEGFNPAKGVEKYREEGRERYLSNDELQRLGTALADAETVGIPWDLDDTKPNAKHTPKVYKGQRELLDPNAVAAVRLLLLTGARLREILHLKWEHVDLDRGLLLLPDSKSGKKTIVLNGAAFAVIKQLLPPELQRSSKLRAAFVIEGEVEGRPRADLKRPWAAIRRHANLDGVRLHDLRHTFASIGAGASLGLPIVGKLLGHSQPQTTARYAHLDADPLRRAANVIGEQLTAALGQQPLLN
jgi:integrase